MVEAEPPTLENTGAEAVFQKHLEEVYRVLIEQAEGLRCPGHIDLKLRIRISAQDNAVRFESTAEMKSPGYLGRATVAQLVATGAGKGEIRVVGYDPEQQRFAFEPEPARPRGPFDTEGEVQ